jgi:hypothetical protein
MRDIVTMNAIVENARAECMRGTRRNNLASLFAPHSYYWTPPEGYNANSLEEAKMLLGILPSDKLSSVDYGVLKCGHVKKERANILLVTFTHDHETHHTPDGQQLIEVWKLLKTSSENNNYAKPLGIRVVAMDSESEYTHYYQCAMSFFICWDKDDKWTATRIAENTIHFATDNETLSTELPFSRLGIIQNVNVSVAFADKRYVFVMCKLTDGVRKFAESIERDHDPLFSWCQFNTDVDLTKDFKTWSKKPETGEQDVQNTLLEWKVFEKKDSGFVTGSNFIGVVTDTFNSKASFEYANDCQGHVSWPAIPPFRIISGADSIGPDKFLMDRLYVMLWWDVNNNTSLFSEYMSGVFKDDEYGKNMKDQFMTSTVQRIYQQFDKGEKRLVHDVITSIPSDNDIEDERDNETDRSMGIVNKFVVDKYLNTGFKASKTPEDFKTLMKSFATHIKKHNPTKAYNSPLVREAIEFVESNDAQAILRYTGTCAILEAMGLKDFRDNKPATAFRVDNILKCTFTDANINKPEVASTDASAAMALIVKLNGNVADNEKSLQKASAYFVQNDKTVPSNIKVKEYSSVQMLTHCQRLLAFPKFRKNNISVITDMESDDMGALSVLAAHFKRVDVHICIRNEKDKQFFETAKVFLEQNKPEHVHIGTNPVVCCDRCPQMSILQGHYKTLLGAVGRMAFDKFTLPDETLLDSGSQSNLTQILS